MPILSKFKGIALIVIISAVTSCTRTSPEEYNSRAADPDLLHQTSGQLTTIIIRDIFKPPVASRIYAYANLAANETLRARSPVQPTLAGRIREFSPVPAPEYCKWSCNVLLETFSGSHSLVVQEVFILARS